MPAKWQSRGQILLFFLTSSVYVIRSPINWWLLIGNWRHLLGMCYGSPRKWLDFSNVWPDSIFKLCSLKLMAMQCFCYPRTYYLIFICQRFSASFKKLCVLSCCNINIELRLFGVAVWGNWLILGCATQMSAHHKDVQHQFEHFLNLCDAIAVALSNDMHSVQHLQKYNNCFSKKHIPPYGPCWCPWFGHAWGYPAKMGDLFEMWLCRIHADR